MPFLYVYTTPNTNVSNSIFPYFCNATSSFDFSICNSTNNVTYLNVSFKDVFTNTFVNGSLNNTIFYYYPTGYANLTKSYAYQSPSKNNTYRFCMYPNVYNYTINYTLSYSSEGYLSSNKVSNGSVTITNLSTDEILYLFNSSIYRPVTFQVVNSISQQLEGVYVYLINYIDPNNTIISSGYTDSGGIIQFTLNSTDTYKIYFSKSGYDSYSTILTPTDTFYTITLGGSGVTFPVPDDYSSGSPTITNSKGVTYTTRPQINYLSNGTSYAFNLTIDSGTWSFDSWGFNLTNQNGNLINQNSSTNSSGGTLNVINSTSNYTTITMNFYYVINGNRTVLKRVWTIVDLSDNSYSINRVINDVTDYIGSGLFGITARGLSFIVFFIIFIGAGVLSYKYGITSPVAICGFIFALVWFFDVSLQWIPRPYVDYPVATLLTAFVFAGFIIKEVSQ